MVPFAGYSMPLQYGKVGGGALPSAVVSKSSLPILSVPSHNWVRAEAGLFDVGHMVQTKYVSLLHTPIAFLKTIQLSWRFCY